MTTTREAALEAALKLARNRLQACAIDYPTGSREMAERSEWADEATAALSTPATEPQGLAHIVDYTNWRGETARRVIRPIRMWWGKTEWHPEEQWMLTAWDCEKDAIRDFAWQDMRPVQNPATSAAARPAPQPAADPRCCNGLSPADCATTPSRHCDGMISAQPAADTRVVTVAQLKRWASHLTQTNGRNFQYAEIRTIIEGPMQ